MVQAVPLSAKFVGIAGIGGSLLWAGLRSHKLAAAWLLLLVFLCGFTYVGMAKGMDKLEKMQAYDMDSIDAYLNAWDEFAQGKQDNVRLIREEKYDFERQLCNALEKKDKRAPSRFVFYGVVTVGMPIACNGPLGAAFRNMAGDALPKTKEKDKDEYFPGDLYFWWLDNKNSYEAFPLFDQWSQREFAQKTVIPMYQRVCKKNQ